ncbi:MAG TPA: hypothetical protein ENK57_23900 [Polyangiaceae bacterium]|nr:hypothetical protein [Polyangiaceae bacterium]
MRADLVLVAALASGWAPLQCGSEYDPTTAVEETPGEALYHLAEEFERSGNRQAWQRTLEHLIQRFPSSRFAATARHDLEAAGITAPPEP